MYRVVHFFAVATGTARQRLLDAAIDHVAGHGLTDLSLRRLAAELGTSHRMLIHHFGSKDGLWVAIIQEVERRQLAAIDDVMPDPAASFADAMRAWWRHISDPSLWPNERLFFEVYGQALAGHQPATQLLDGIVESWLGPATEAGEAMGLPHETARASARLGIAVTRGLLLDLLATQDRAGVDAAMEHWIGLNERLLEGVAAQGG
jgi:AcrR family transcriptional regulator